MEGKAKLKLRNSNSYDTKWVLLIDYDYFYLKISFFVEGEETLTIADFLQALDLAVIFYLIIYLGSSSKKEKEK